MSVNDMTFGGSHHVVRNLTYLSLLGSATYLSERFVRNAVMTTTKERKEQEEKFLEAAQCRDLVAVEQLIRKGVNPNCHQKDRVTALHVAAERGDVELGKILKRSKKLNLNCFTSHGYPPLIIACNSNQIEFAKYMLDNGADANITERFFKTALHHVVMIDSLPMAALLIQYGADLNALDTFHHTPLSEAVIERSYLPMVKLLVKNGAKIEFDRGDIAMHLFLGEYKSMDFKACLNCYTEKQLEVIKYLLAAGTNPNMVDATSQRNALHLVALTGYLPLARVLGEWRVKPNRRDRFKKTPLDIARSHDNNELADFLEDVLIAQQSPEDSQIVYASASEFDAF